MVDMYVYISTKASRLIDLGILKYLEQDAVKMSSKDWNHEVESTIRDGCNQLINGRGINLENPLENLGIQGCYNLFSLLHFEPVIQKTRFSKKREIIDEIIFEHKIIREQIKIFNKV
jgi:hypothetical protein